MYTIEMSQHEEQLIKDMAKSISHETRRAAAREDWCRTHTPRTVFAEWTTVEGAQVLRVEDSRYIGVPVTRRKSSAQFVILDLEDNYKNLCTLAKKEVHGWLIKMHS